MGIGMLLSALSGGGNAAANVGRDYQKTADEEAAQRRVFDQQREMERLRTDMNVAQASRIAENQRAATAAPLNEFSTLVKKYSGEQVPLEAPVLDGLTGSGTDSGYEGFHGDPAVARANVMKIADPELRALGLRQIDQQEAADKAEAAGAVEGVTRMRTPEEAAAAALADAKLNNPTAYLAGKALSADKYMTISGDGMVLDTTTGKIIARNDNRNERARELAENKLQIAEANNASREEIARLRMDVAKANGSNTPSIVATANWLIENGVAKTKEEAWMMAKEKSETAGSDRIVKIAGILSNQPGYKPVSNTGKGKAADLFADAKALEASFDGGAPAAAAAGVAPPMPAGLPAGSAYQPQYAPRNVWLQPDGKYKELK